MNDNNDFKDIMNEANSDATEFLTELNSMKLDADDINLEEKPKTSKRKTKKDKPTPNEVEQMSDDDILSEADEETVGLFDEFSSFLEMKTEIAHDEGVKEVVPTGIELLDAVLGGGFAIGAFNIVVGQPGSGKSMLAIQTLGNMQRKYNTPFAAFLDSEEATTIKRLSNLGVNHPKIKPYTDITVEKVFKFLEGICLFKEEKNLIEKPALLIWDSIANTLTEKEREVEDVNSVIGYKARLLSILIPKYVAKMAKYNIGLLAVNQLRDNLAMGQFAPAPDLKFMTSSKQMPGGNVLKYNAFQLVEMKTKTALKPEKYGFEGIIAKAKCVKNKIFRPNVEVEIVGDFTHGFTNFWTNYNFMVETKRLKSGAWNYLTNLPETKFRTKEAENLYNTDDKFREAFDEAARDAIKIDIISKYDD